jgi:ectoine hydroxylase-related dioxygenase (phytanoyl-CoA dioxygenase family)
MNLKTYRGFKLLYNTISKKPGLINKLNEQEKYVLKILLGIFYLDISTEQELINLESNDYFKECLDLKRFIPIEFITHLSQKDMLESLAEKLDKFNKNFLDRFVKRNSEKYKLKRTLIYTKGVDICGIEFIKNNDYINAEFKKNIKTATKDYIFWDIFNDFMKIKFVKGFLKDQLIMLIINMVLKENRNFDCFEFKYNYQKLITNQMKLAFEKDGYMVIKNFISSNKLNYLIKVTEKLRKFELKNEYAYIYGNGKLQRVYNLIAKDKEYINLLTQNLVYEILENFFDHTTFHTKYYLSSYQANILMPGAKEQKVHVDSSVPDPLPPWKIRLNINFLLDDFNQSNGSTIVIPGSHRLFKKPNPIDLQNQKQEKITAPKGSIVFWHGHLWHKSGNNETENSRTALLACFAASYLREIAVEENYIRLNLNSKIKFNDKIKELVGFNHGIKTGATY